MRVLIIVGLVVFVAAFLGAWIAVLVMARKAAKARELREREAWRGDRDDSTPGGPGAAAWMPLGVAGMLGAAAATDAGAEEERRRASQSGDGGVFVDPGVYPDDDATPDVGGGGWGDGGGSDGGGSDGGD
jgi:hypothetical protein